MFKRRKIKYERARNFSDGVISKINSMIRVLRAKMLENSGAVGYTI